MRAKLNLLLSSVINGNKSSLFLMLSTLLIANTTGAFALRNLFSTISSSAFQCVPSTTKIIKSTSPIALLAARFIKRLIARFSSI